jgi:hypothetical protein
MRLLAPTESLSATCPRCRAVSEAGLALAQVRFGGAVTVVETRCPACATVFYQTLPNGQYNRFPVSVSADGRFANVPERGRWLVGTVREAVLGVGQRYAITPSRSIEPPNLRGVILLLCLDPCYGHALMMLFNAQRHHAQHPDRSIIVVVPRGLAWLVPDYVAETWVLDAPLSALTGNVSGLDEFVKTQLVRFGTVWFSTARIHFDHRTMPFAAFTRTQKFDLAQFSDGPLRYVTLVLREDRLWLRHGWERWLHKALTKLGLGQRTRHLWARWQAARYRKLAHHIHQQLPGVSIVATGLTGGGQQPIDLGYAIHDDRQPAPLSPEQERIWAERYAQSHVVVGVHGSGMLLPTSVAAGFICLLPPDKLSHYAEDILMAHDNPIHQTLLGRFMPTAASPRQVAETLVSILTEFPVWLAEAQERQSEQTT